MLKVSEGLSQLADQFGAILQGGDLSCPAHGACPLVGWQQGNRDAARHERQAEAPTAEQHASGRCAEGELPDQLVVGPAGCGESSVDPRPP
jgi:hypothetical protein